MHTRSVQHSGVDTCTVSRTYAQAQDPINIHRQTSSGSLYVELLSETPFWHIQCFTDSRIAGTCMVRPLFNIPFLHNRRKKLLDGQKGLLSFLPARRALPNEKKRQNPPYVQYSMYGTNAAQCCTVHMQGKGGKGGEDPREGSIM